MSTNLQTQSRDNVLQCASGVWYELRTQREELCAALLRKPDASAQLQERLRLIDDALDRIMAGTYGDCVVCGKWIEYNKLDADPALPFCCGCQRKSEAKLVVQRVEAKGAIGSSCYA